MVTDYSIRKHLRWGLTSWVPRTSLRHICLWRKIESHALFVPPPSPTPRSWLVRNQGLVISPKPSTKDQRTRWRAFVLLSVTSFNNIHHFLGRGPRSAQGSRLVKLTSTFGKIRSLMCSTEMRKQKISCFAKRYFCKIWVNVNWVHLFGTHWNVVEQIWVFK